MNDAAILDDLSEPVASCNHSVLLEHACGEYCARQRRGETIDREAFCERYPSIKSSLIRFFHVVQFMGEQPELFTSPPPAWPEVGSSFLGFELKALLGEGGFARVYLATQPALANRHVVVKVSPKGASEAQLLARVSHRNIVPIHSIDADVDLGLTAICMPYLGRATLHDVLDRVGALSRLPESAAAIVDAVASAGDTAALETAASAGPALPRDLSYVAAVRRLLAQLLDALAFMHEHGIVHQDIKPSNVLMTPAGTPMLLDFNLSVDLNQAIEHLGGTPLYMSPEQLLAFESYPYVYPAAPDARTDLFGLGVVFYELLTGKHPFIAGALQESAAEIRRRLLEKQQRDLTPIRSLNPAVDPELATLVERCLAFSPQSRPASARDAIQALRRRPTPRFDRPRRRALFAAAAAAVVGLFAAAALTPSPLSDQQAADLRLGQDAQRQERYEDAVKHFDRVLKDEPDRPEVLIARGQARQALGVKDPQQLVRAIADFEQADRLAPEGRTKALVGHALILQNQGALARIYLEQALEAGYEHGSVLSDLASLEIKKGRLAEAEGFLERALKLHPQLQSAYHQRARVALQRAFLTPGDADPANQFARQDWLLRGLKDVELALKLGPANTSLYYDAACLSVAAAQQEPKRKTATLEYLEQAVKHGLDPSRLESERHWTPLAEEPGFIALCRRAPAAIAKTSASSSLSH